jgi:hypothetical protein
MEGNISSSEGEEIILEKKAIYRIVWVVSLSKKWLF